MFLIKFLNRDFCAGHPRVSGDVSEKGIIELTPLSSSPRERGCFFIALVSLGFNMVIPA